LGGDILAKGQNARKETKKPKQDKKPKDKDKKK